MSDYENKTPTSIAWVKKYVSDERDNLCGLLGGEMGRNEKKEHEAMKEHVAQEVRFLLKFIEAQAKTLDRLSRAVDALISANGKGKAASTQGRRRA